MTGPPGVPRAPGDPVFRSELLRLEVWLDEQLARTSALADETARADLDFQACRQYLSALAHADHPAAGLLRRIQTGFETFLGAGLGLSAELGSACVLAVEREKTRASLAHDISELESLRLETRRMRDKLAVSVEALGQEIQAARLY